MTNRQKNPQLMQSVENAEMPRKPEPFGHYRRMRLVFSGFFLKLPLSEKAIMRRFRRNPKKAEEKYLGKKTDNNTMEAITGALKKYNLELATPAAKNDLLEYELNLLQDELSGLARRKTSINEMYQLKLYLDNSESYLRSIARYEKAEREMKAAIAELECESYEKKERLALAKAVESLKRLLADAKVKNLSEILG